MHDDRIVQTHREDMPAQQCESERQNDMANRSTAGRVRAMFQERTRNARVPLGPSHDRKNDEEWQPMDAMGALHNQSETRAQTSVAGGS